MLAKRSIHQPVDRHERRRRAVTRRVGERFVGLLLAFAASSVGAVAVAAPLAGEPAVREVAEAPAFHLEAGATAHRRLVAVGRDLEVAGDARSHAVALRGDVRLTGRVDGDIIALDGDVDLAPGARVGGDVYVLGGTIAAAADAVVAGRSVAYPDASALWLALLEGRPAQAGPRAELALRLALLAFWTLVTLTAIGLARREVLATSQAVRAEPIRSFILGLVGVAAMTLTALLATALIGAVLGVPLLFFVASVALVLRFWGMVAVFHALGDGLHRLLGRRPSQPLATAAVGLVALGLIKLVPLLGVWSWSLATFLGVGATLSTRFGRRDPWLEPIVAPPPQLDEALRRAV
ncbi:MAG: hypothetical protein AAGN46_14850 [Acidobacteriota bacterium]